MDGSTSGMKSGRWVLPAGQFPAEELQKPAILRRVRIVEVLSVKMFRKFRGAQLFLRLIVPCNDVIQMLRNRTLQLWFCNTSTSSAGCGE